MDTVKMKDVMKLDLVIVNWNSGSFLSACLHSLQDKALQNINQVIVVDNNSSDNSIESIGEYDFDLRIIKNTSNKGFGAACNQGAKFCKSKYILFLNPDTEVFENSLSAPLKFMEDNVNVGIAGVRLEDRMGNFSTSCARFPSLKRYFYRATGLTTFFPRYFKYTLMKDYECNSSGVVDQIMGAFFLIRKDLFDSLNGFDERFFVYMEEVDLSYRVQKLGYKSYFLSEVTAFHQGGGCSDQIKSKRVFFSLRSRLQFFEKHFGLGVLIMMIFEVFILEFFSRLLFFILTLNLSKFLDLFKIYGLLYGWALSQIIKRKIF